MWKEKKRNILNFNTCLFYAFYPLPRFHLFTTGYAIVTDNTELLL